MTEQQHRPPADEQITGVIDRAAAAYAAPEGASIGDATPAEYDWRAGALEDAWQDLAALGISRHDEVSVSTTDGERYVGELDVAIVRGEVLLVISDPPRPRASATAVPWRAVGALRYHAGEHR